MAVAERPYRAFCFAAAQSSSARLWSITAGYMDMIDSVTGVVAQMKGRPPERRLSPGIARCRSRIVLLAQRVG
jgi:hypothetical protein